MTPGNVGAAPRGRPTSHRSPRIGRLRGAAPTAIALMVVALWPCSAHAEVVTAEREGLRATLYAPDWVWHGQNISFLIVLENPTDFREGCHVTLHIPYSLYGDYPRTMAEYVTIEPRAVRRFAFSNLSTEGSSIGRAYEFRISVDGLPVTDGPSPPRLSFTPKINIIRGSVVAEGIWAAILPAAVATAWCVVLALYFRRHAAPGAWKTPSAPVWEARIHG